MRQVNNIAIVLALTGGAVLAAGVAQVVDTPPVQSTYDPGPLRAEKVERWQTFNAEYENRWRVRWNPVTGTPHRISAHHIDLPVQVSERNVEELTRTLLTRLRQVLQINPGDLVLSKADHDEAVNRNAGEGTWYVAYKQRYRGLPVDGGSVRLIIRGGRVTTLGSDFYPGIKTSPEASVTLEQALRRIHAISPSRVRREPVKSGLIIYPMRAGDAIRYHLAWDIIMPVEKAPREQVPGGRGIKKQGKERPELIPVQWRYLIDAHSGEVIDRIDLIESEDVSGTVTGMIHPKVPADSPVEEAISRMKVTVTQEPTEYVAGTDAAGNYLIGGLSTGAATLEAHFVGFAPPYPVVIVYNDETPDPDATHSASLTVPTTHDWNWSADDPSPAYVETNAFYHVSLIRDWFQQGDPFDVVPEPDPMVVRVRNGPYCNAMAGGTGLYFGSGTEYCEDFALCADIVYHEYTHRVVHKVYDDAGVPLPYEDQTGAMNEGWSDYFGASIVDEPYHGSGCYTGRNIDTPDMRYPDDWEGGVHHDGMIFSGALWDTRTVLGAEYVGSLALRAMKQATVTFDEYLEAILEEDDDPAYSTDPAANNDPADGTPNIDAICHAYTDLHGIYCDYCEGYTEEPVARITLPDPLEFNLVDGSASLVTIEGTALGSVTEAMASFVLEYAHESAIETWLTDGITLVGGGTSPISSGPLGELDISGLADGFYVIRLTVTTTGESTATAKTPIIIDTLLLSGWPQEMDTHFYVSPAVADLDPDYPGLEVVAHGGYYLYVWHADGTMVTEWPQYAGSSGGAPAIADLDVDGTLEIVTHTYRNGVRVFRPDGTVPPGWPQSTGTTGGRSTTAIADLDGDGDLEVVVGSRSQSVYAWHHDGTNVAGWPIAVTGEIESSPAVGDLDGDGLPEVVIGANDGKVHAWHGDGTVLAGWPQILPSTVEVSASAALGDLDGDGDLEIAVGTKDFSDTSNQKIHVWHHDGTALAGWPIRMSDSFYDFVMRPSSAVIADLDGNGDLEVIVMANSNKIYVWNADTTPVTGWPPAEPSVGGYEVFVASPSVADIDADGDMELVADAASSTVDLFKRFDVYSFHHDATSLPGWPKAVKSYSNSSTAVADIDLDGDMEILVGSDGLFIWAMPSGSVSEPQSEWPFYRHDIRRTGTYEVSITAPPPTLYVDVGATGANNGTSWPDALTDLQDAYDLAAAFGTVEEIWVAEGTYLPDRGTQDRTATFRLLDGTAFYGGFPAGGGDGTFEARDPSAYASILSGDLNGDDGPDFANNADNSYHVTTATGTDATAVLDGFTVSGGNADGTTYSTERGGGLYGYNGSPTVINCTFQGNWAEFGGGVSTYASSNMALIDCKFFANEASGYGGGMHNHMATNQPSVTNCIFTGNTAGGSGGGMHNTEGGSPVITNCSFSGNSVGGMGGAISMSAGTTTVTNCVLWGNTGVQGSNETGQIFVFTGTLDINYTCVQEWTGSLGGVGNIGDDPLLTDADGADDVFGTADDNLRLLHFSPAIDAGDDASVPPGITEDLDGRPRFVDGDGNGSVIVDMGAYEADALTAVLLVDADATGVNNGTSWENAYTDLQDALDTAAAVGGFVTEIRVAGGTYKPDRGTGDRDATFQLLDGVPVYGGYAGFGAPDPDERDFDVYQTILSGDLNGDDGPDFANNAENSYHVTSAGGTDATAVLDGFTISGGNADGATFSTERGGGLYGYNGSPTVINCTFQGNWAHRGGGVYTYAHSNLALINCKFFANEASGHGGGMYNHMATNLPSVTNCLFTGNVSGLDGGGIFSGDGGSPIITNSSFSGNVAAGYGGGIGYGTGMTVITNCVLWGNEGSEGQNEGGQVTPWHENVDINYTCVQGWTGMLGGVGNIGDDPKFVDADGADNVFGTPDDNLRLLRLSPCIDAGDNASVPPGITTDLDGNARIVDGDNDWIAIVDMGAYERPKKIKWPIKEELK